MRATTIAICSAKGGAGKTVIAATFATTLASLGKRVLMVDTDAATNGLTLFFLKEVTAQASRTREKPLGLFEAHDGYNNVRALELAPNLHLLPATYEFHDTALADPTALRKTLDGVVFYNRDKFDFIILDAQPGSDPFAAAAISEQVSDKVIIVSEYDPISAAGVERLKALFPEDLHYQRTWVLLNKMLPEFIQLFSDFLEIAKYLSPLPWNREVITAYAHKELAVNLETGSEFTLAVIQTLRSLLTGSDRDELEKWLDTRSSVLRNPVRAQIGEARAKLEALREQRTRARQRRQRTDLLIVAAFTLLGVVGGLAYSLVATASSQVHLVVAGCAVIFGFSLGMSLAQRLRRVISSDYEDDLQEEIVFAAERVRRLTELADLDLRDLVRLSRDQPDWQPPAQEPRS